MRKSVALFLILALMLTLCACGGNGSLGNKKQANYSLYIKDSEFYFTDFEEEPWQLSYRLVDNEDVEEEEIAEIAAFLGQLTYMSTDGSLIFFPDKISGNDDGFNLYYRNLKNREVDAVKIDSDVTDYDVNVSASKVVYKKGRGDEGNLYQYSVKDDAKEKIASEIRNYEVSKDGNTIYYVNAEGNLYLVTDIENKEKLAGGITSVVDVSEDFTTFYYIKDEALYKHPVGGEKEKIDTEIDRVLKVYDTGEIYYLKENEVPFSRMDFFLDDMKEADEAAPTSKPSKPYSWNFNSKDAYNKAYEEYEKDYEAYNGKNRRDNWRSLLIDNEYISSYIYTLCYYDGTEKTTVTNNFSAGSHYLAADKPVITYLDYDVESVSKKKFSEILDTEEFYAYFEQIPEEFEKALNRCVALGSTVSAIEQGKASTFRINGTGSIIYYIDDIPENKNYGDLYSISIADNVVGKPERYDTDVYAGNCQFLTDSQFLYFKEFKDGAGDLYINKTKVDYDVNPSVRYIEKLDKLYYYIDWSDARECGSLKEYANGKSVKIADDIHSFMVTPNGRVLYLYDYSLRHCAGELYVWNNGESQKIDDDVIALAPSVGDVYHAGSPYYGSGS